MIYNINCNGIEVEITHTLEYFHNNDHVEWRSVPCSVTETGYYSDWLPVNSEKDVVINWIQDLAKNLKVYIKPLEQQSLF